MQVEYEERFYAAGKISGSRYIKREGKPSDKAVLSARQIDRPIRPLFPKSLRNEIQIVVTVLSYDGIHNTAVLGTIATSAALMQTGLPFEGPIGSARVAKIDGKIVICPDDSQADNFEMDNDFDTENAKFKATGRYSFGWTDPRGLYGTAGA